MFAHFTDSRFHISIRSLLAIHALSLEPQIPPDPRPQLRQLIRHALHILIPASTQTDHHILPLSHLLRQLTRAPDRMRRLQRWYDALHLRQCPESNERL